MYPDVFKGEPVFLTKEDPFMRFRIGAGPGSYDRDPSKMKLKPGSQFPAEGYDNFTKQGVPRWTTTDDAIIAAYIQLVDKVCPCVVLVHSQSGPFGQKVAQARPDKVKALVLVEPSAGGDPASAGRLSNTPVLAVYGDYIEQDPRWPTIRANEIKFLEQVRSAGGRYDIVDLPKLGIRGNSHMMMMDKNSDQVAGVIQGWLEKQGLYK
jgi:pimeloyl-ACP methyl ester carboxylesterase